jgi:c-di-GMP-binding flagellar brake protein YcgR
LTPAATIAGSSRDLSLTGCYVLTGSAELELELHADVQLCLRVDGDSIETPARVIMIRPESGAAFRFLPIDPEMRSALLTLIRKLSAQFPCADPVEAV